MNDTLSSTRGSRFDLAKETSEIATSHDNSEIAAIRVFVWARQNIVGNKDPKDFVIAVCELVIIYLYFCEGFLDDPPGTLKMTDHTYDT